MSEAKEEFFREANEPTSDFLERLREEIVTAPKQPDEFTITEIASKLKINRRTADNKITKMFNEGKLARREGYLQNGHPVMFYRFVE